MSDWATEHGLAPAGPETPKRCAVVRFKNTVPCHLASYSWTRSPLKGNINSACPAANKDVLVCTNQMARVDALKPTSSSSFSSHAVPSRSRKRRAQVHGYRTPTFRGTPRPSRQRHYALTPLALLMSIPRPPAGNVPEALIQTGRRPIPLGLIVQAHRLTTERPPLLFPWLA